jgi:hypothetical protein
MRSNHSFVASRLATASAAQRSGARQKKYPELGQSRIANLRAADLALGAKVFLNTLIFSDWQRSHLN